MGRSAQEDGLLSQEQVWKQDVYRAEEELKGDTEDLPAPCAQGPSHWLTHRDSLGRVMGGKR